jgi:hypothetical protein
MRLNLFRRRINPADLPPVSGASMPGPLHSGLTGDLPTLTAAAALDGAAILADVVTQSAVKPATDPAPAATSWPEREPQPVPGPIRGIAPLESRPPLWLSGIYTVTYDRVGDYGRRGTGIPPIMPLTCHAKSPGGLAERIASDVDMLIGLRVTAVVDQAAGGGYVLGEGGARIGSFTFAPRKDAR